MTVLFGRNDEGFWTMSFPQYVALVRGHNRYTNGATDAAQEQSQAQVIDQLRAASRKG